MLNLRFRNEFGMTKIKWLATELMWEIGCPPLSGRTEIFDFEVGVLTYALWITTSLRQNPCYNPTTPRIKRASEPANKSCR